MGGGTTTYGIHARSDRDRESQSTVALNVLLPDSTLSSGNVQQGTLGPCVSLHGSLCESPWLLGYRWRELASRSASAIG